MFAYDMLETSSRNLGWQTHYLNLVYTPRKAMSAVIAAEAMRRLPRGKSYGPYPGNTKFGPFRVSYEENSSEMVTPDAFLYAGSTRTSPGDASSLRRIAGYGSSPVVTYDGEGVYFGWTGAPPSNLMPKLQVYNNRIIRTGNEALQVQNLGDGTDIHHNTFAFAALHWRDNGLGKYQDNNSQVQVREGTIALHHNIFMGGASNLLSFFSGPEPGDGGRNVTFQENYFADTLSLGGYFGGMSGDDSTDTVVRRSRPVAPGGDVTLGLAVDEERPAYTDYGISADFPASWPTQAAVDVQSCGTRIDLVQYGSLPKTGTYSLGASPPTAEANDLPANWCTDTTTTPGSFPGTPQKANTACP